VSPAICSAGQCVPIVDAGADASTGAGANGSGGGGCSCDAAGTRGGAGAAWLVAGVLVLARSLRRRRRLAP
jgi:MYXO-CTERM domain-containing protein